MLRPLSQVEIIPMPYVTEATKVNIILPVTVHEAEALSKFLAVYEKVRLIFMVLHIESIRFIGSIFPNIYGLDAETKLYILRIAWLQKKMFYLQLFLFMAPKMLEKFIKKMILLLNRKIDWMIWKLNMAEENQNQKLSLGCQLKPIFHLR